MIRFLVGASHFISGSVDPAELISLTSYSLLMALVNQESTHMLRTLIAFEGRGRGASVSCQPYANRRSDQIRNMKLPHDQALPHCGGGGGLATFVPVDPAT